MTIREIVLVAGVGVGTFYEYFDSKDALARACVHLRTKELLQALTRRREALAACDLAECVAAVLDAQFAVYESAPREWAQHALLERHKSDVEYYRAAYELFVEQWRLMIVGARDWPGGVEAERAARLAFALVYGAISHALLRAPSPDFGALRSDLARAALARIWSAAGRQ